MIAASDPRFRSEGQSLRTLRTICREVIWFCVVVVYRSSDKTKAAGFFQRPLCFMKKLNRARGATRPTNQ